MGRSGLFVTGFVPIFVPICFSQFLIFWGSKFRFTREGNGVSKLMFSALCYFFRKFFNHSAAFWFEAGAKRFASIEDGFRYARNIATHRSVLRPRVTSLNIFWPFLIQKYLFATNGHAMICPLASKLFPDCWSLHFFQDVFCQEHFSLGLQGRENIPKQDTRYARDIFRLQLANNRHLIENSPSSW